MLISLPWIRELCAFETAETALEIGARFSLHTAEVETVIESRPDLAVAVAARVLEVRRHPDADRLTVVRIAAGEHGEAEVVCGAPNVREGLIAPWAPPGTTIGGKAITRAPVRGVLSSGMLLSEKELGVSEQGAGLWELPPGAKPGDPVSRLFPDLAGAALEVDNKSLTHRPDLWGHHGVAREFSAIYRAPLAPLAVDESLARAPGDPGIRVTVEASVGGREGLCRRYCGLRIDGVRVGPSPPALASRLLAVGARPINNIVDVTNYILFELGQPLHAFDAAMVEGGIRVRKAAAGESIGLLDGTAVPLEAEDLVIADARTPLALAGIMGGARSEISESTASIFLESANFAPARVRRTSVRVGKRTDSSLRFEKSLDPENARIGILRAARRILDLCPGSRVTGPLQDVGYEPAKPIEISTSAGFITRRLGTEIAPAEVKGSLERLGFECTGSVDEEWTVRVPSWRATKDISLREDLVEEVGRIHGYGRIQPFPPSRSVEAPPPNEHRRLERRAKEFLTLHGGLTEVYTYSMVGEAHCRFFGLDPEAHLRLVNPVSEDMDRMRREITPVHLEKARENQRYRRRFGFFEMGRTYRKPKEALRSLELPDERTRCAGVLSFEEKRPENFFEARNIVLGLLQDLRIASPGAAPCAGTPPPWAHPAVCAVVLASGTERGWVYRVHPEFESRLELRGDVIAFDLDFDALLESPRRPIEYRPPSRYPVVPFDVAVVVPERTTSKEVLDLLRAAGGELLVSVEVFDVFRSTALGEGKKSMAFHLIFGSRERTLEGGEITALETRVMDALRARGYTLREG